ncbi:VOC family protein [Pseudomonas japonica]|uniref:VOC family protein n=1 Tax=Pseudomonas japonica TaxID=256466 RepID=UPI003809F81B
MAHIKELAYVVFEAGDLDAWEHFATELLGMQLAERADDSLALRMDHKAYRWMIQAGAAEDLVASGFEVASDAALDQLVAQLRDAGFDVMQGDLALLKRRKVKRLFHTRDPMGNRVELVTGFADADTPFASTRLKGRFVTGAGGAGHEVLAAHGVSRATYLAFYEQLLGFRTSDIIIEEVAPGIFADLIFMRCNERHHSLALGEIPLAKNIHHIMVEVSDYCDVGTAYDRCLDARQPIEMTLGQHPNDQMLSFYVLTPSGFSLEYGWGGLRVDDATWEVKTLDRLHSWGHRPPEVVSALLSAATPLKP